MDSRYEHTQHGPLWLFLSPLVIGGLMVSVFADDVGLRYAGAGFAAIFALLVACFAKLTVRDRGDHLEVRFGPLPWWGTRVRYDAIEHVEATRSRLLDGWGVHWLPGRGWTFNLWGFDCVEITTTNGVVRIGTDEPEQLARFLSQ